MQLPWPLLATAIAARDDCVLLHPRGVILSTTTAAAVSSPVASTHPLRHAAVVEVHGVKVLRGTRRACLTAHAMRWGPRSTNFDVVTVTPPYSCGGNDAMPLPLPLKSMNYSMNYCGGKPKDEPRR